LSARCDSKNRSGKGKQREDLAAWLVVLGAIRRLAGAGSDQIHPAAAGQFCELGNVYAQKFGSDPNFWDILLESHTEFSKPDF